ncbi:uncharacterized protein LOC117141240 [Drosophila mauritiana]|uniref:Cilia- and flagella-associated protein 91 n=1 Tax=Drosophila mauritiana TaxID=7226 RepID=A0A6P8JWF9_DROMA|nr:uncharacterized protein LOC117141240 [Drosophila mauritiana]
MSKHNTRLDRQVKFRVLQEDRLQSPRQNEDNIKRKKSTSKSKNLTERGLSSCLINSSFDLRITGGENDPAQRTAGKLPRTDSECQFKAPGYRFLTEQDTAVNTHEVKMSPRVVTKKDLRHKCDFFAKNKDARPFKNKITQTLYRESSAQTMAYLPEIFEANSVETLELFSLPSIFPVANRPGLHEVEILERARKRWAFSDALKVHFKNLLQDARKVAIKTELKEILEAIEWEQWIQREEDIQECQMMRLQIVIKMFDKREKEIHAASKTRIETACERIEQRRQAGLRKNEIEFQRGMRRLEFQLTKNPRRWEKQRPMYALGSPCSEFYAPLSRYGVDPARRNFVSKTAQKAFDMRIDDLEKRINNTDFKCPFRKLKDWSKPKKYDKEYERNFCKEDNLQKLFECLKGLRTQANAEREEPKCLVRRRKPELGRAASQMTLAYLTDLYERSGSNEENRKSRPFGSFLPHSKPGLNKISETTLLHLKNDRKREEMEHMLNIYEGTYVGWVMQFLSEEMTRLSELRRLHFFSIMAQKERWRREAAEAGLRQKENELRLLYEELFQHCNVVNNEISNKYFANILSTDMYGMADGLAGETVSELAKKIDADILRWLESFKLIQNPLTYVPLRMMLNDMISPNMNDALQRYEKSLIAQYVLEDVIFPKVWNELDPFDIGGTLTSDLIDRLIDNDLCLMSTDSESETPQKTSWREAHAIIRKLIRQAVPGDRWLQENERVVHENYNDLFDDVFANIFDKLENPPAVRPSQLIELCHTVSHNYIQYTDNIREMEDFHMENATSQPGSEFEKKQLLNILRKRKEDNITRNLQNFDNPLAGEMASVSDIFLRSQIFNPMPLPTATPSDLFSLRSTLDVSHASKLGSFVGRGYRVMLPNEQEKNSNMDVSNLPIENDKEDKFELPAPELSEITATDVDSPRASFHKILSTMELRTRISTASESQDKQSEEDHSKQLDSSPLKLDSLTNPPPGDAKTRDSTLVELKPVTELASENVIPISLGTSSIITNDTNTTNGLDQEKEMRSVVEFNLEPIKTPDAGLDAELGPDLDDEPESEILLWPEPDSFIPPVRSSGVRNSTVEPMKSEKGSHSSKRPRNKTITDQYEVEERYIGSLAKDHTPVNDKTAENVDNIVPESE